MNQSSARSMTVVFLLVAAVFIAMMRIVQSAPLGDWWLVLALLVLALLISVPDRVAGWYNAATGRSRAAAVPASSLNVYEAPAPAEAVKRAYPPQPSPHADLEDDYGRIRDTEVRADVMASATHMETDEALENEGMVENVMSAGATGRDDEVDEIAGAPTKSISATQEMRAVTASSAAAPPDVSLTDTTHTQTVAPSSEPVRTTPESNPPQPPVGGDDDLTVVEGIGPKMSAALKAAGITTFTQLQSATLPDLEAAIRAAGMRFAPSMATWAEQAAFASRGEWDELKAYQKTLKSGRKK